MSPIAPCCGADTSPGDNCPISPHAATGWCLQATGAPVLVVTTLPCPPGDPGASITVTLIDPSTGDLVAPQAIVSCGNHDWEVDQLCDYDPDTGELIATFLQLFEWDTDTGTLVITNVRADDPTILYTPTGTVRACATDNSQIDVEVTDFCYDPAGPDALAHGWQAWIFIDSVHTGNVYFDAAGSTLVAPTVVDCPDLATEATLAAVLVELGTIDGHVDGLEACCTAGNLILTAIEGNTDGLEALLTAIDGHVDGLEACCAATNVLLTAIDGHVDGIEALITASNVSLTTIASAVHLEDDPAASGAAGTFALAVRNDTDTVTTSTDGDYSQISVDSFGRIRTRDVKLEDAPHVTGDPGSFALGVRNDANAVLTTADLDYSPLATDSAGRLKGPAEKIEDAAHASGDVGAFVLGVRNDANAVLTSADGDYSPVAVDSAGRIKTVSTAAAAIERKVDGGSVVGAGVITIPDGVLSFAVTVSNKGTSTTINGPDFAAGITLYSGQSIGHSADESNTLNGPITITTVGAGADANAIWVKP